MLISALYLSKLTAQQQMETKALAERLCTWYVLWMYQDLISDKELAILNQCDVVFLISFKMVKQATTVSYCHSTFKVQWFIYCLNWRGYL
jgi:hypothetical protein